jgi:hypothetical protein
MKKILISLAVLACVAPAMADVNITAVGNGGNLEIYLETTGAEVVRGLALELAADGTLATSGATTHADFNTYIDFAFSNSGYQIGQGHPLAVIGAAGAATLGDADVSLSVGVLDEDGFQEGFSAATPTLIATVTYTGAGNVCMTADMLRGGVVGDDVTVVNIQEACVAVGVVQEAVKNTAPFYGDWETFGKPACWAYRYNSRGDVDGLSQGSNKLGYWQVGSNDLTVFLAAWEVKEPAVAPIPSGAGIMSITDGICADFARDVQGSNKLGYWRVGSNDLSLLLASWEVKNPAVAPIPSGPGLEEGDPEHYNYFIEP